MLHSVGPKTHVLGHSGPFRYRTKVDAKLAELEPLMPMFARKSCVGIFRNERTGSTPFEPKLTFRTVSLLQESRCKTSRTGAINAQVR
jgi:hypothetical protein